jgi:heat shock protein HslJ
MAMGGESTGWTLELDSAMTIGDKEVNSIQVSYSKSAKLEKLANQRVNASGKLVHRHGVETGDYAVLELNSIKKAKSTSQAPNPPKGAFELSGSEWLLEDLAGNGVIDNAQATLAFPGEGKVSGHGSCNRFSGSAEIKGENIKIGPLASSRMACPEAVMHQEAKYLEALQQAERFEWKAPYLLIYCKGADKPLRFTRKVQATSKTQ